MGFEEDKEQVSDVEECIDAFSKMTMTKTTTTTSICPTMESLPWPVLNRLFSFLLTNGECKDLGSLYEVSTHFRSSVKEFMMRDANRPEIRNVILHTTKEVSPPAGMSFAKGEREKDALSLEIRFWACNLRFYDFSKLEKRRFWRLWYNDYTDNDRHPRLRAVVMGPEDPILEQLSGLFPSCIEHVSIGDSYRTINCSDLSICENLLLKSTIQRLTFSPKTIGDHTAPAILSIANRTLHRLSFRNTDQQLTSLGSFFHSLVSLPVSRVSIECAGEFFNGDFSFLERFLDEKLSNGTIKWIRTLDYITDQMTIMKRPIHLFLFEGCLEWENAKCPGAVDLNKN
ncbi:hypothetical protein PMAYCL1PPCAC_03505 [Pristionchus mayeri]|uniref:F-box domain-containing protein n=1 Tax=Pristionchus mayeri TaxID=1317129 RepID=A0AAN4Z8U7_9BILA|nr:hypothetical protein PMAYCL1PPCAC_03505 [Pristionchus mayeri]